MQSLDQQLNSLSALRRPFAAEPVDRAGAAAQLSVNLSEPSKEQDGLEEKSGLRRHLQQIGLGLGLALAVGIAGTVVAVHQRYSDRALDNIPLFTEAIEGQTWTGEGISFQQQSGNRFDVAFTLDNVDESTQLVLRDIDLTLLMPDVPVTAEGNEDLTRWFLTEREFNRQRVIFEPGSVQIDLPEGLGDYAAEDVSIALTNNCLGAGYWELAVSVIAEEGSTQKIYQGYFTFPRGAYADIVSWLNPTDYWQQARTMEAWPGFRFLDGLPFALSDLRQVEAETAVPVTDLKTEEIIAENEQIDKENLIVYANSADVMRIRSWEDLRQADLQFQSFVTPGIYDENRLWASDFSQLETVVGATGRQITSELSTESLVEVEVEFESDAGETRKLIVSGIDWDQMPRLDSLDYSDGVYMPLGFGTPFTQSYADLAASPPSQSPFFSVLLDEANRVIDYRKDIGINGLVMHRDLDDDNLLHLYLMSYERITLIGHYVIDLDLYEFPIQLSAAGDSA